MFRTQEMVVGAKLTTQFLLVPKENFEKQGPKFSLRKWVVEVDDLIKEYNVPECVDLTEVFVFYHNCPNQHELGIRVKPLELYQNLYNKTKFKPNKQSAPPDVDNENKKARITTDNDVRGSEPSSRQLDAPVEAGQPVAPGQHAAPEPPKKARRLVTSASDEDKEDGYVDVFKNLMDKVESSAKAKRFWTANPQDQTTVFFWTKEVLASMGKASATEASRGTSSASIQLHVYMYRCYLFLFLFFDIWVVVFCIFAFEWLKCCICCV